MPTMPSLLIMQWLIVGFFVLIHFLLGMLRGTAKSAWYLLAYVVTALITFVLIANFTLTWFFTTQESMVGMIEWANGLANGFLTPYMDYLSDPGITPVVFMILDLIIKIILYSILFPIIRWLFTLIIFRPIWKHVFLKKMLAKQNAAREIEHESSDTDKTFKKKKKLKINFLSRLSGGLIGAVRGVLVAFVFLLPILVFGSFMGKLDAAALTGGQVSTHGPVELAAGDPDDPFGLAEYAPYFEQIDEMNEQGFAQITNMITVDGATFDRYVFDAMFTPIINDDAVEEASINFIQELENIIDITAIIVNNGYLERTDMSLSTITDDDVSNVQSMIEIIGQSDLLSYMLSSALDKAPEMIPELVTDGALADLDWTSDTLQATLTFLAETDWHEEFNRIAALVGALNDFMSPSEIVDLMDDPGALASLSSDDITALTDVIRAVGDLHLLAALNLGIEYAISLPDVQSNIGWSSDPEAYLIDRLSFILDNPDFFIGEGGEIDKIADLIETILTDDTADLASILDSDGDLEVIMASQSEALITAIFGQLANMDIIVQGLPIGVDMALYQLGGDSIASELAGDLETALSSIDWGAEITNIGDIYADALSLGLETLFAEDPDMLAFADQVIQNATNMASVRAIVAGIFEDSELVGNALDTAAPYLIDEMISDDDLKDIIQSVVLDANDDFDFNIGQEINNVLTVAEQISTFTTFSDLGAFGDLDLDGKIALIADFGAMPTANYTQFKTALTSLQILSKIDEVIATDLASYLELTDTVYIPSDMLLSDDIVAIIDLARDVANYFYTESVSYTTYEDIDITGLLDTLKTDLLDSEERSDLLFYNIIYQAQQLADDESLFEFLTIPQSLLDADIESVAWENEINALLGAVFDIATSIGEVDGITLSVAEIQAYTEVASGLPIEIITQYADLSTATEAFGGLDSSLILRASISSSIDRQGEILSSKLLGHVITTPEHLIDAEGLLQVGVFTDLINGVAILLDDMNQTMSFETIGDFREQDISTFLQAFNQTEDASIQAFISSDLIHGVISDLITDTTFQQNLVDTLNGAQDLLTFSTTEFAVDPLLLDPSFVADDVLLPEETASFLIMLKALQLNDFEFETFGVDMFTDMFERHVDDLSGEDDFDRFLGSGYIYSVIDSVLQMDAISTLVSDQLGSSLGDIDMSGLDLTLPNAMLGQQADADAGDIEPIEVGRLPKEEFRKIFTSLSLVDMDELGINTFTSMVSPVESPDDFDTFMASDFIYFILSTLFDNDGFGDYIGDQLGGSFGDSLTLDMSVPTDAKGTQAEADSETIGALEVDRIRRSELRNIMISFSLLDIESDINVGAMLHLFETTYYEQESPDPLVDTDNDFYQFVDSIYLQAMVSQILLSDAIIDTIAGTGTAAELFDAADFNMPSPGLLGTQPDGYDRLTKDEIYYIFNSLNALGITDFEDIDLGLDTIQSIDDEALLKSNYLYEVLDLAISNQDSLTIPTDALETSGVYNGMITKDEIHRLFTAFNTLPDGVSPTSLDVESITSADILAIINAESLIINQVISDEVEQALASVITIDNLAIPEAYETTPGVDRLLIDELRAMVLSMDVIGLDDLTGSFEIDDVGLTELENLHDLGLGDDGLGDPYDSYVIHKLITDQIETALSVSQATLPEAYYQHVTTSNYWMEPLEVEALITAMGPTALNITDFSAPVTASSLTNAQLLNVHYLGLGDDGLGDPYDSYIIHQLITEQIETALSVSQATLPEAYYQHVTTSNYWMEADEVSALITAMGPTALNITDFSAPVTASSLTNAQLLNVHYLGLGDDGLGDPYDSYIIHQLITEQIETALSVSQATLPEAYYQHVTTSNYWMEPLEVEALITAMGPTALNITDFSAAVTANSLTSTQLMNVHYLGLGDDGLGDPYDSYIIHQLITEQIETALSVSQATLPEAYYQHVTTSNYWMEADEVSALITSLDEMGIVNLGSSIDANNLTQTQLQNIHYLGLGDDGISDPYDSYIIHRMISDGIKGVITNLPTTIYMANNDITAVEVQGVIDAVGILDSNPSAPLTGMDFANAGLTPSKIEDLLDINSRIIYRQISAGIIAANLDVAEAYAADGAFNYDAGYATGDLKITEMYALVAAMNEMGISNLSGAFDPNTITVANLQNLHYIGLGIETPVDTYQSYMVHHMISDGITTTLTNRPSTIYMANGDMTASEVQGVISAVGILNTNPTATLGGMSFANAGLTADKIGDLLDLDARIIDRQISEGIITAGLDVPEAYAVFGEDNYDALYGPGDIKIDEMYALVEAMDIMGISNLSGAFDPNTITVANLQNLHYVGLGIETPVDTYQSYMVHHMISDGITTTLTNRPSTIYMANGDMTASEVQGVISSVGILNTNPTATLGGMSFANAGLTADKISDLLDLDARIIDRQISEGIITAGLDVPEAYAVFGEDNYDALYVTGDLNIDEMYAITAAMDVMGISDLSAGFSADDLTTAQLQELHYIGQGIDPVTELYDSYMIHNIISDSLTLVNPQTIAYDADGYIKAIEIQGFIDDLNTLGVTSINSFATISDSAGVLSVFSDDAEVTAVFANSAANDLTLLYYFIDDIMDPSDNTIPGATRTTDPYGFVAIVRNELAAYIIANN